LGKADGTACILLPGASGAGFAAGIYRFALKFRQNNTALDLDSIVLSAAGQSTAPAAVLDISLHQRRTALH
jgi:hypothetical protein